MGIIFEMIKFWIDEIFEFQSAIHFLFQVTKEKKGNIYLTIYS